MIFGSVGAAFTHVRGHYNHTIIRPTIFVWPDANHMARGGRFYLKSLKYNFRKSGGLQKRGEEANIPDLQHRTGGTKKEGVRYLFTRQRLLGGQVFSNEWNNQ